MYTPKNLLSLVLLIGVAGGLQAQSQLALRNTNYSGTHGIGLNPASFVGAPISWQVNLVSGGVFVENNYMYIHDANLFKVLNNLDDMGPHPDVPNADGTGTETLLYDFYTNKKSMSASENTFVMGPSAVFAIGSHHFGITLSNRTKTSVHRANNDLNYYKLATLELGDQFTAKPFATAAMAWSEIGLNYARPVAEINGGTLSAGATLKVLLGHEGGFIRNKQTTTITSNIDSLAYEQINAVGGFASSFTDGDGNNNVQTLGWGLAMDLGATYIIPSGDERPYSWKLGASLLDIGYIRFNKNASKYEVALDAETILADASFDDVESPEDFFAAVGEEVETDPNAYLTGNAFTMFMPAAFSLQADYSVSKNFFVNATAVRSLSFIKKGVRADNILSITPRYESRWFEAHMPIVLYDDRDLRMGLALRMGWLTVGTDNLGSYWGQKDFTGTDFYFALKFDPINLFCKKGDKSGGGKGGGFGGSFNTGNSGGMDCYWK